MLAKDAQVVGANPNPSGSSKTYTSSTTDLEVQEGSGATTKTYKISVAAYHATTNPYGVYTPAHLHAVRNAKGASYRLMQDVTLPNADFSGCTKPGWAQAGYCNDGWKPIGTDSTQFTGTFDGNGHSISNLFILRGRTNNVGLFGAVGTGGTIRNLGVHMAAAGVTGQDKVGGLVGYHYGTITNCYATGAISGRNDVGGLVGNIYAYTQANNIGILRNSYATGAVSGRTRVGGLVGDMYFGILRNSYATGAVSGSTNVGGLVGYRYVGHILSNSYYPKGRPAGAGGAGLDSGAEGDDFSGFTFTGDTPAWKWVAGKWPQLNGFEAAQTTPSLTYRTATVKSPSAGGFTITLAPALNGLMQDDWALYKGSNAVQLTGATTSDSGANYVFTATLTPGAYSLRYTKADVIFVPGSGYITVTVP